MKFILPNQWSSDTADPALVKDISAFASKPLITAKIASSGQGKTRYIALVTEFWSLAIAPAYGFDFAQRSMVFYGSGSTAIDTSTWPQIGRAVAALLSLPINPEKGDDDGEKKCLARFAN